MAARLAALVVWTALLAGCGTFAPSPADHPPSGVAVSEIAYVGSDDQIYVAGADGSNSRRVTAKVSGLSTDQGWAYRWPTYSPDGRRLSFAGYRSGPSQPGSAAVLVADAGQASATALLESAGMATVYVYWSPDNRHLAALLQHGQNLELHLLDAMNRDQPRRLLVGQPLYWSWAPDGNTLAVHVGGDANSNPDAWVGLLHLDGGTVREERFADAAGDFRAPAWSPSGAQLAFATLGGGSSLLSVRDANGKVVHLSSSTGNVAFNWSPSGEWLAYAAGAPGRPGLYQGLEIAHPDGSQRHGLSQDPLVAFYWSPDSSRLAVIGVDPAARQLTWTVLGVDGKTRHALGSFIPSSDFAFQLPFFDQYAQSTSIWSADGTRLLFGADAVADSADGAAHSTRVLVLNADGPPPPTTIADGSVAVFSPRPGKP